LKRDAARVAVRAAAVAVAAALSSASGACHHDGDAVLLIVVTADGSPPVVSSLDVTLTGPAGTSTANYARGDGMPLAFPTTLTAVLPPTAVGDIMLDVQAKDAAGAVVASGHEGGLGVTAGSHQTVYVELACGGGACLPDAGTGQDQDGGPDASSSCGNGRVDPGETCDTAIPPGSAGACPPPGCNPGIPCLRAVPTGSACTARCDEITTAAAGDRCCPANATHASDPDCSERCGNGAVDPGETCDIAIPAGTPGACPAKADCATGDPCSTDELISAGTCSAVCVHAQIATTSGSMPDGCCPAGANKNTDTDCSVVCGDGVVEMGEACEVSISPLAPGGCPVSCDDMDPTTTDFLVGAGCQVGCSHFDTKPISGDGVCLPGSNHETDSDCRPSCGNSVLEPGELCDKGIPANYPNACPTSCPAPPSACLQAVVAGSASDCSAHCVTTPVTTCSLTADGCCPAGCDSNTDADCSPRCGDGALEPTLGEICDTGLPAGNKKACPTSCPDDGNPCTQVLLLSAGTCAAKCVLLPVTIPLAGDGCCPPGADFTLDPDCSPQCGNGVVETPAEKCDWGVPGSCPSSCPAAGACTLVTQVGMSGDCTATCVTQTIVSCLSGDGCCPSGCTALTDSDCPVVCGDGAVEGTEACDRAITPGLPGACPKSCDDGDACTLDVTDGSPESCTRSCRHVAVTACIGGDGCCPAGCSADNDTDCNPTCGDGLIGAGETCDPPSSCPTTCPDDGDPCTREQITGDPLQCNVVCRHVPITTCSGATSDACCPTGCAPASDTDC
jgi:hypothetical protein